MGALIQRAHRYGEGLAARIAVVQAGLVILARGRACVLAVAAMRTDAASRRPAQRFKVLAGGFFVRKDGICRSAWFFSNRYD